MSIKNILKRMKNEPPVCGGNDTTIDPKAPKEILSEEMTLFDVTTALDRDYNQSEKENTLEAMRFVSAFAVASGDSTFMYLETGNHLQRYSEKSGNWAIVKEDIFPSLVKLVRERNMAKNNGYHSMTHGLPENFGGSMDIRYSSGEAISVSDNGSPILNWETGYEIAKLFTEAMKGEKEILPDVSSLREIRFEENRDNGGFTKAVLAFQSDGTGINSKQSKYDNPTIYESSKTVDEKTITAIKKNIEDNGMFAWSRLPSNGYSFNNNKKIDFVFEDGSIITVKNDRLLPGQIRNGFFNIELELTTKH